MAQLLDVGNRLGRRSSASDGEMARSAEPGSSFAHDCPSVKAWVKGPSGKGKPSIKELARPCLTVPVSLFVALAIALSTDSLFSQIACLIQPCLSDPSSLSGNQLASGNSNALPAPSKGAIARTAFEYAGAPIVVPVRGAVRGQPGGAGADRSTRAAQIERAERLNDLSTTLISNSQYAEAAACLRQAISIDPGSVAAHNNLAIALFMTGRSEEAEKVLDETVAKFPRDEGFALHIRQVWSRKKAD